MNIELTEISPSLASRSKGFKKIILSNGTSIYPNDSPQDEYQEIAIHALEEHHRKEKKWKMISNVASGKFSKIKKQILQHTTRSRNILCITADAPFILHHSTYTLNAESEIIPITSHARHSILNHIYEHASKGNSLSAIGIKKIEGSNSDTRNIHNLIFLGIVLHDYSMLPDATQKIHAIKKSGATVKLFSEELLPTCKWIARKIGLHASNDFCITSDELQSMSDSEVASLTSHTTIFAEMKPIDRERLLRILTSQGHTLQH